LLGELKSCTEPAERKLSPATTRQSNIERFEIDVKKFRWLFNENAMATEKLAEGIRIFNADAVKLKQHLATML
jgi:transaldolase